MILFGLILGLVVEKQKIFYHFNELTKANIYNLSYLIEST